MKNQLESFPWTGKSCFSNRALVKAFPRLWNAFKNGVFEASKLVSTKALFLNLKHDYRRQGIFRNLSDLHLLPHLLLEIIYVIVASENSRGVIFRKDVMCITSKISRGTTMESQTCVSKRVRREFRNWRCKEIR